jgi:hypothetical protein
LNSIKASEFALKMGGSKVVEVINLVIKKSIALNHTTSNTRDKKTLLKFAKKNACL